PFDDDDPGSKRSTLRPVRYSLPGALTNGATPILGLEIAANGLYWQGVRFKAHSAAVGRKQNACVLVATQSSDDLAQSDLLRVAIESCPTSASWRIRTSTVPSIGSSSI